MFKQMKVVVYALLMLVIVASPAAAQLKRNYWGLTASMTPKWEVPDYQKVALDADAVDLKGKALTVGFVRGDTFRGDWGVSYVRRTFDSGSTIRRGTRTTTVSSGVVMNGVELRKFASFGTIKERVQIGLDFGVGAGWTKGNVVHTEPGKAAVTAEAKELFNIGGTVLPVMPIGRLELAAAVIVTPQLKLRVSGGLNFPGQQVFSFGAVYLFGAR